MTAPSILFLGLATYSRVGGLQNFNRRVIANLGSLAQDGAVGRVAVHLMDDGISDVPSIPGVAFRAFGRDRLAMIRDTMTAALRADVLLVGHVNLVPIAWIVRLLHRRIRTNLFVHGDEVWNDELRPRRFAEPWLLKSIDRIASVSAYTARIMAKQYCVPLDRFTLFPNAIDDFTDPPARTQRGRKILCVTRMGPGDHRKNVDQLLRAIALLRDRGRPATLTIAGDGVLRGELEVLATELDISEQVQFAGRVSDEALANLYAQADAFALPSSKEGFGIVYLEAWAHGLPVLCGRQGAPHEIVEDHRDGRLADEDDATDIADKLDDLLTRDDATTMGKRGLEKVRARYLNANARQNLHDLVTASS